MNAIFKRDAAILARDWGIHLPGVRGYFSEMAADALPPNMPVTAPNSGIPALFTTYTDPTIIKALITPTKSEDIYGSAKKGDWVTDTAQFPVVELSGYAVAYDDYSQAGTTDPNANWVQRQSFHFQTWTKWGEREVERMGAAKIDWVNQKNMASISVLNKNANLINLFGLSGLELYGALNDPQLHPAIAPVAKVGPSGSAAAGNSWLDVADPVQVYGDILKAFGVLTTQMGGNLTLETPMTLVIPTERQQCLLYTNQFQVSLADLLKKNLPGLKIETLPEAGTNLSGGNSSVTLMQLFVNAVEGQQSVTTAFTEKLRAHAVERYSTNFRQKKSQGSWGTIWFYPQACVTMAGI
ncbi:hypothetical protein K2X14_11565 [Acetobacter sp. TBRC 12305]|uniref:DUF2184 domain-containing protein n=1 Tax=Acetobacter garciniae TaxID=2817435 RepID=A0A939HKV1_9PROT|nr:hypothetical protein [Acetobacter garciniae]MBO1325352.1 hypothetical protein [Acetobacter garciniae]MBX0345476.1 hypothetical protein [Acetobacter garciniae]